MAVSTLDNQIQDQLNDLNSKITHATVTVTKGSKISSITGNFIECNGFLYGSGYLITSNSLSKNDVIFSVPSGRNLTGFVLFVKTNGTKMFLGGGANEEVVVDQTPANATERNDFYSFDFIMRIS